MQQLSVLPKGKIVTIITSHVEVQRLCQRQFVVRSHVKCFQCGELGHVRTQCMLWKTRLCWNFMNGNCRTLKCSFAHGEGELRRTSHISEESSIS